MKLILINGYPHPYPEQLGIKERTELTLAAQRETLAIEGVKNFLWEKHYPSVELVDKIAFEKAIVLTGWEPEDTPEGLTLIANVDLTSSINMPPIVVRQKAYHGFFVTQD
jgi:hypothetical protein